MKTLFSIICLLFITILSYSQGIGQLEKSLDSLKSVKIFYEKELSDINREYKRIEDLIKQKRLDETVGDIYICLQGTLIYDAPESNTSIAPLPRNSRVKVLARTEKYSKVAYENYIGWVISIGLVSEASVIETQAKRIEEQKVFEKKMANLKVADQQSEARRKAELIKKYGTLNAQKILEKKIWLDMTDEMARESWGVPDDINRSVYTFGVHEQWVYEGSNYHDTYLYFEDGVLTSWQD